MSRATLVPAGGGPDAPRPPSKGPSARSSVSETGCVVTEVEAAMAAKLCHADARTAGPTVTLAAEPRTARAGASEVAAVLGIEGAWGTPFAVWAAKVGLPQTEEQSPAMRRGHVVEPGVLRWLAREVGAELVDAGGDAHGPWVVDAAGRWPHVGCHPDGYLRLDARWEGAEAKSTRDEWPEPPPHVWVQVQVSLALSALPAWHVGALAMRSDALSRWRVDPDPETAREMLDRVEAWWAAHVTADQPPPVDASEDARRWLLSRYPRQRAPLRQATAEEAEMAREVARLRQVKREVEAAERTISADLCQRIGDADGLDLPDGRATWRAQTASRVDVRRLRAEAPDVAERFLDTSTTRVLRVSLDDEED